MHYLPEYRNVKSDCSHDLPFHESITKWTTSTVNLNYTRLNSDPSPDVILKAHLFENTSSSVGWWVGPPWRAGVAQRWELQHRRHRCMLPSVWWDKLVEGLKPTTTAFSSGSCVREHCSEIDAHTENVLGVLLAHSCCSEPKRRIQRIGIEKNTPIWPVWFSWPTIGSSAAKMIWSFVALSLLGLPPCNR